MFLSVMHVVTPIFLAKSRRYCALVQEIKVNQKSKNVTETIIE